MKKLILFLFVIVSLSGCISTQKIMNSWIGRSRSDLILDWGPPTSGYASDGKGGEILLYNYGNNIYVPVNGIIVQSTVSRYSHVYCDSNGKIYHIRWGGY